jgi:hypothetical protein
MGRLAGCAEFVVRIWRMSVAGQYLKPAVRQPCECSVAYRNVTLSYVISLSEKNRDCQGEVLREC